MDMQFRLDLRSELQRNSVADDVSAKIAVVRPILMGLLYSLKQDIVTQAGGYESVSLEMLGRLRRQGDGDCGICYEYAVHDAIRRSDPLIIDRIADAVRQCKVPGNRLESILFGAEKSGTKQLIDTAASILTDESRVLVGKPSQPPKLKAYLSQLAAAFRRESTRRSLPSSINGLWKADLFLGCTDSDRWIGSTVKINARQLEAANGLRVGIVPAPQGGSDRIFKDETKNLIICPLPYDQSFMEVFYSGWGIVQQFFQAGSEVPKEVYLPLPADRQVARELHSRRKYPTVAVIDALIPLAQPEFLETQEKQKTIITQDAGSIGTNTLIAPISLIRS